MENIPVGRTNLREWLDSKDDPFPYGKLWVDEGKRTMELVYSEDLGSLIVYDHGLDRERVSLLMSEDS